MIKANGKMGWVTVRELWSAVESYNAVLWPFPTSWKFSSFEFLIFGRISFSEYCHNLFFFFQHGDNFPFFFQCCAKLNDVVKLSYKWLCNTLTSISTTNGDETSTLLLFLLLLLLKAAKLLLTFIFRFNCFKTVSREEWFARTPEHQTGKMLNNRILALRKNAPHALNETLQNNSL